MSRFSRAYEAAIKAAELSRAQAAAAAGMDASYVSRLLNDERPTAPEHVEALIRALPSVADREHCILEFLVDQCPPDYRERLILHFGKAQENRPRGHDSLSRNLASLEGAATENPDLRKLLANLADLLGEDGKS